MLAEFRVFQRARFYFSYGSISFWQCDCRITWQIWEKCVFISYEYLYCFFIASLKQYLYLSSCHPKIHRLGDVPITKSVVPWEFFHLQVFFFVTRNPLLDWNRDNLLLAIMSLRNPVLLWSCFGTSKLLTMDICIYDILLIIITQKLIVFKTILSETSRSCWLQGQFASVTTHNGW